MASLSYLSSPAITAGGEIIAYVVSKGDEESGRFFSQIMIFSGTQASVPPACSGKKQAGITLVPDDRHTGIYLR